MRSYQSQNRSKDYCFCVFEELNVKSVNNFNFCVRLLSSVGFLCLLLATDTARAQSRYVLTDLGTLGGENRATYALGINNRGEVVGQADVPGSTFSFHAFLYKGGKMQDLGTLGGAYSTAKSINKSGETVGDSSDSTSGFSAFFYR